MRCLASTSAAAAAAAASTGTSASSGAAPLYALACSLSPSSRARRRRRRLGVARSVATAAALPAAAPLPPPPPPPSSSQDCYSIADDELPTPPRPRERPRLEPGHADEINVLLRNPALHDPLRVPRYPLVLCHGLYGFDVRGPAFFRLHYWGDLLRILRGKIGATVHVTSVPGTGAITERANRLHESLVANPQIRGREINFLAHSMGGLDARHLLTHIRPDTYHPRSLTTLSTPHHGSDFMDWCRANIGVGSRAEQLAAAVSPPRLPYSLKSPVLAPGKLSLAAYLLDLLDSPAYANLTPGFMEREFNPATPDRPDVRYFSIAARTAKLGIWHPLWLPKLVLDGAAASRDDDASLEPHMRGNDGLVPVHSAAWGEFLGTIDNCDHWEMRGSSGLLSIAEQELERQARQWSWQDVYVLVAKSLSAVTSKKKSADGDNADPRKFANDDKPSSLLALARWISSHLPLDSVPDPPPEMPPSSFSLERMAMAVCRKLYDEGL